MHLLAVGPLRLKSPALHAAVYLNQIPAPAEQAARAAHRPIRQGERRRLVAEDLIQLSEIVEADLGLRELFQLTGDCLVGAEIPEQAVADASVRHTPQLFLGGLQRLAWPGGTVHLKQHGEDRRKPPDGS